MDLDSLIEELREARAPRLIVVSAPRRRQGAHAAWRIAAGTGMRRVDAHALAADPFEPLTRGALEAALACGPDGLVLDGTGARPWDDPVFGAVLRRVREHDVPGPLVLLLPPRLAGAAAVVLPEPASSLVPKGLGAVVEQALAASGPRDDDGPSLRREILRLRQSDSGRDQRDLAVLLLRLGQYESAYGTARRALLALRESSGLARMRAIEMPADPAPLHDLAGILDALADAATALDELEEATAAGSESAEASARGLALNPGSREAAWGSTVSALRDAWAARGLGMAGAAVSGMRAALSAARERSQEDFAHVAIRLAELLFSAGQVEEAAEVARQAERALEGLLSAGQRRFDLLCDLTGLLGLQAALATTLGTGTDGIDAAAEHVRRATALVARLMQREPWRMDWQAAVAATATTAGDVAMASGDLAAARQVFTWADRVQGAMLRRDPERTPVLVERARLRRRLGYAAMALGIEDAWPLVSEQLRGAVALWRRHPKRPGRLHDLALAILAAAIHADVQGHDALARRRYAAALRRAEAAALLSEPGPHIRRTLLSCRDALGSADPRSAGSARIPTC